MRRQCALEVRTKFCMGGAGGRSSMGEWLFPPCGLGVYGQEGREDTGGRIRDTTFINKTEELQVHMDLIKSFFRLSYPPGRFPRCVRVAELG